jgi:branched-chain amino acid transport system ATP-binding protein
LDFANVIRTIRDKYHTSILLVEHDMRLVMDVCDRICAINFGKFLAVGSPKEIQRNKAVQAAYLGTEDAA